MKKEFGSGREAESGGMIEHQQRHLGASADWQRSRFTMDDGLSEAVRRVFVKLHKDGLIYRDKRLVNWDPAFNSDFRSGSGAKSKLARCGSFTTPSKGKGALYHCGNHTS